MTKDIMIEYKHDLYAPLEIHNGKFCSWFTSRRNWGYSDQDCEEYSYYRSAKKMKRFLVKNYPGIIGKVNWSWERWTRVYLVPHELYYGDKPWNLFQAKKIAEYKMRYYGLPQF